MINNKYVVYENKGFKVNKGEDIFNKIKTININQEQENFLVFYLNAHNNIIKEEVLFIGGIDACLVCPNTIFKNALVNNSKKIIVAHNHPSKNLTPSSDDLRVFEKLKEMGEIIDIRVLDSIIFNIDGFYSAIEQRGF